jgi:hypothetical protein
MAKVWVTAADGSGRHPSRVSREGGAEDPRGVLLSVDRLVVAAGDSIRRLRHLESVSLGLDDEWSDEGSIEEMVSQLDEVRGRLMRLRDEARRAGPDPHNGVAAPPANRTD